MNPDVDENTKSYRSKKILDKLLPVFLILLATYLYLDFLASSNNIFYSYKAYMKYIILAYFVTDLIVLFTMYENNKEFVRNHWLDIMLTVPFITAFKGLRGFKLLKSTKGAKVLKSGKLTKGAKLTQKSGKLVKKGKKQLKKL